MAWHIENARQLPWRGETDPYRIWLSEIMLMQTRTKTVKKYYKAFLEAFQDVFALASADEQQVLKLWEGMGYYSRARNLHAAAKLVARERNGVFPETYLELKKLPGVGEYAAGAIASIAFRKREPALDGNQARVLARVFNIRRVIKTPAVLYDFAKELVPKDDPGEYNQALMGLGALICKPRNPACGSCPVKGLCAAHRLGCEEELPVKPEKMQRRVEKRAVAIVFDQTGRVYMRKRGKGLLEGLWEFPGYADARNEADVRACLEEEGIQAAFKKRLPDAKHVFTHLEWQMTGYLFEAARLPENAYLADRQALDALTVPTALRVYREECARLMDEYARDTGE